MLQVRRFQSHLDTSPSRAPPARRIGRDKLRRRASSRPSGLGFAHEDFVALARDESRQMPNQALEATRHCLGVGLVVAVRSCQFSGASAWSVRRISGVAEFPPDFFLGARFALRARRHVRRTAVRSLLSQVFRVRIRALNFIPGVELCVWIATPFLKRHHIATWVAGFERFSRPCFCILASDLSALRGPVGQANRYFRELDRSTAQCLGLYHRAGTAIFGG